MEQLRVADDEALKTRETYVAGKLRQAILRGQLKPGQRLDQNEIAEVLHVSRSPVREALRTLAAEGLVEVYPHRGAVVAELSTGELEEVYAIRAVLEGMAARMAAPHMDERRLAALEHILAQLNVTEDLDEWVTHNRRFHHTIYGAVHRPRLMALIENLRNTSAPYIRNFVASPKHRHAARESHQRIFEACLARDGVAAQKATQKHLKAVCQGVVIAAEEMEEEAEPAAQAGYPS